MNHTDMSEIFKQYTLYTWPEPRLILDFYTPDRYGNKWKEHPVIGCKGEEFMAAGYVWAPYIPMQETPNVIELQFEARQGLLSRYGEKEINPNFYGTLKL